MHKSVIISIVYPPTTPAFSHPSFPRRRGTSTVVTYEVVISAHNPDLKLKPRLTANITIYILDKKDVLSVPNKALRFTSIRNEC